MASRTLTLESIPHAFLFNDTFWVEIFQNRSIPQEQIAVGAKKDLYRQGGVSGPKE